MDKPLIINLAPTGLVPTRAQSPHVPLTPQEIAADVLECAAAGAAIVHLHARDGDGLASNDAEIFSDIITRIRRHAPELVITTTTSGRRAPDVAQRASTLFLDGAAKPDMASLTLGSMNFSAEASINPPATIFRLAELMRERGIRPELEVFDVGMINVAHILASKQLIEPPFYFNFLLGNPGTAQANLLQLATMVAELPAQSFWSVAGLGRFQTRANGLGVVVGDGVRVGLEDNLWLDDARTQLATNLQMVQRVVAQAQALGRPVATARQVRTLLGLRPAGAPS